VFLLEYVVLFYFSNDKIKFVKSHKIELIIVIFSFPIVPEGLASTGFLRFARLPRLLNALRFFRLAALLSRFGTTVKAIFNSKGLRFIVYATIAIVLFFGFLFYISEPDVQSYSDGLWWALVTITTVGYGDITPLTNLGRIIASSLMIMGIGFIATITAAVSSYFISSFNDKEITINELGKKLDIIEKEIKNLKKEINDK